MGLLKPGAPFVQFTYAMVPPIPKTLSGIKAKPELIWLNLPPARGGSIAGLELPLAVLFRTP